MDWDPNRAWGETATPAPASGYDTSSYNYQQPSNNQQTWDPNQSWNEQATAVDSTNAPKQVEVNQAGVNRTVNIQIIIYSKDN